MFIFVFISIFFITKLGGGYECTNMIYFPRSLTWKEMYPEIPTIAIMSFIGIIIGVYILKKMKIW